jgi:hypothetical protein
MQLRLGGRGGRAGKWVAGQTSRLRKLASSGVTSIRNSRSGGNAEPPEPPDAPGRRAGWQPANPYEDVPQWRLFETAGRLAASTFANPEPWSDRCVETVFFPAENTAVRQVTVDLTLPELARAVDRAGPAAQYWVPLTTLHKHPPSSRIDLTDESGATVSLLNRVQHAVITAAALYYGIGCVVGRPLSPELKSDLFRLCYDWGPASLTARAVALMRLTGIEAPSEMIRPEGLRIANMLRLVHDYQVLWVPATGKAGQRRTFKFRYELPLVYRRWLPTLPGTYDRVIEMAPLDDAPEEARRREVRIEPTAERLRRSRFNRALARVTTQLSLAGFELDLRHPHVAHARTYHLQVIAPSGLEVRSLKLLTVVRDERDSVLQESADYTPQPNQAQVALYGQHEAIAPAAVQFRVGRRGLLTQALAACILITTLLWGFSLHVHAALNKADVAAPVLLIAPAVLVALAIRPGEHLIASMSLGGVRTAVAVAGGCGVLASAGFAGVHFVWATPAAELHFLAIVATVSTGLLLVGWILALRSTEAVRRFLRSRWRKHPGRYLGETALLLAACAVPLALAPAYKHPNGLEHGIIGSGLTVAAMGALWVAGFARECADRKTRPLAEFGGAVQFAILGFAASLAYGVRLPHGSFATARDVLTYVCVIPFGLLLAYALAESAKKSEAG